MGWGSMSATQTKGHLDVLLMRCLLQPSCTKCSKEKTPQSWWRVQDWIVFSLTRVSVLPCSSCCSNKPEPDQPRQLL